MPQGGVIVLHRVVDACNVVLDEWLYIRDLSATLHPLLPQSLLSLHGAIGCLKELQGFFVIGLEILQVCLAEVMSKSEPGVRCFLSHYTYVYL